MRDAGSFFRGKTKTSPRWIDAVRFNDLARIREKILGVQVFPGEHTAIEVFDVNARATSQHHKVLKEQSPRYQGWGFSSKAPIESPAHCAAATAFAIRLPIPYFNRINLI